MRRKVLDIEKKLIQELAASRADPSAEAPLSLRDQPTEIVFTALQPKKKQEQGVDPMGFMPPAQGGMSDPMGGMDPMAALAAEPMPPSDAESGIMRLLGMEEGGSPGGPMEARGVSPSAPTMESVMQEPIPEEPAVTEDDLAVLG